MPRLKKSVLPLPSAAAGALLALGRDLRIARERRGESLAAWSTRIGISIPTLRRMEAGDPTVAAGTYASALWLVGLAPDLGALAAPERDQQALALDIARAARRRSV